LPKLLRFALVLIWQILVPNQSETPSENEMWKNNDDQQIRMPNSMKNRSEQLEAGQP
jgi:hypothetical protein